MPAYRPPVVSHGVTYRTLQESLRRLHEGAESGKQLKVNLLRSAFEGGRSASSKPERRSDQPQGGLRCCVDSKNAQHKRKPAQKNQKGERKAESSDRGAAVRCYSEYMVVREAVGSEFEAAVRAANGEDSQDLPWDACDVEAKGMAYYRGLAEAEQKMWLLRARRAERGDVTPTRSSCVSSAPSTCTESTQSTQSTQSTHSTHSTASSDCETREARASRAGAASAPTQLRLDLSSLRLQTASALPCVVEEKTASSPSDVSTLSKDPFVGECAGECAGWKTSSRSEVASLRSGAPTPLPTSLLVARPSSLFDSSSAPSKEPLPFVSDPGPPSPALTHLLPASPTRPPLRPAHRPPTPLPSLPPASPSRPPASFQTHSFRHDATLWCCCFPGIRLHVCVDWE